jgi:hypothetical protein
MTAVNFAVATLLPRVARRFGGAVPLVAGVILTLVGMGWLAEVNATSSYLSGVALPMVLIGAGQGLAFAPLTTFVIAAVRGEDADAASGLVNTAHQLGMALGLAALVARRRERHAVGVPSLAGPHLGHRPSDPLPGSRPGRHRPRIPSEHPCLTGPPKHSKPSPRPRKFSSPPGDATAP